MRVLLVDHDSEAIEAISRAIRGVLELDCVTSKGDALLLLRQNPYDVLIACERCVDGSGLDLLGRTTRTAQPIKRIFAAAPERLQLLGPRLAPFKVQRTINYPIDLEELWLAIAQVTSGPNDETDGTVERVVLDERGIPAAGTVPRAPIPPRPPAPLRQVPPPAPLAASPAAAMSSTAASGRFAALRVAQPAPEPPLRAPPPPRMPPAAAAPPAAAPAPRAAPMRAAPPPIPPSALPPMALQSVSPPPAPEFPEWTQEIPAEDDFAEVSAQARFGVQQKTVDEATRRKRVRLLTACGIALVVAGGIVFLIEKFYDPEARAREQAIAASVAQMAEQQKATDDLTLIEIDIENAIMNNDLDSARRELAKLVEKSPNHPRREFLQASIDRAAALAKLAPATAPPAQSQPPAQAAVVSPPMSQPRAATQRAKTPEREPERFVERATERVTNRDVERAAAVTSPREIQPTAPRTYGAPIGDAPRAATIPLDAPINSSPTTNTRGSGNAFVGRTLEASDASATRAPAPLPTPAPAAAPTSAVGTSPTQSGSAAVSMPPAAAPAPEVAAARDIVPAKLVRRVTPVAPIDISRKIGGYVVVSISISASGRVMDVNVVESKPAGTFDESALAAVRKWLYEPRRENGVAVASNAKARLVFDAAN